MEKEKSTIEKMIRIFCREKHEHKQGLCPDCQGMLDYAWQRLDKCPFKKDKPPCSRCRIHCYEDKMREKIIGIMRFSGPKMLIFHPMESIRHILRFRSK